MTTPGDRCSYASPAEVRRMPAEPELRIGLHPPAPALRFFLSGRYDGGGCTVGPGWCTASATNETIIVQCPESEVRASSPVTLVPHRMACSFTIPGMVVGAGFHWSHREDLTYGGALELLSGARDEITAVNRIGLESYLESVISSEMNPLAPDPFLEAHAVVARSWVLAQLGPRRRTTESRPDGVDIWEWFDREDHELFDLCADDHCQRYHGQTRRVAEAVAAVRRTRGLVLCAGEAVVDARFSKCCGGMTERFTSAWGGPTPAGISSVLDAAAVPPEWLTELSQDADAEAWIHGRPPVFCGVNDAKILDRILLPMDRATEDFFRWQEHLSQDRVAHLIEEKTGAGIGDIEALVPLLRGASGRVELLEVRGTKGTLRVGKELTIRRLLSSSHLKSSSFVVRPRGATHEVPRAFDLAGAGWGHGVGMCQIGAGAMASSGFGAAAILTHYFPTALVAVWY